MNINLDGGEWERLYYLFLVACVALFLGFMLLLGGCVTVGPVEDDGERSRRISNDYYRRMVGDERRELP